MKKESKQGLRFGVLEVLDIVFVVLKLTGVVTWSWWIVLAPISIPLAILLVRFMGIGLITYVENIKKW